jgi:tetratricopeptide (TPR) repeat protein
MMTHSPNNLAASSSVLVVRVRVKFAYNLLIGFDHCLYIFSPIESRWSLTAVRFWSVFWVDVSTISLVETGFLDIAKRLNVSVSSWQDGRQALANVQQPWMLILDNADDPNVDYQDYFPSSPHGVVVMTSRNQECQQYVTAERIALEGLPIKEAQELLFKASSIKEDQRQALQGDSLKVAGILQSHPLALTLAGAYIRSGHCTLARYPDEYQRQRKRLLRFNSSQCRSRYRDVYATFEASIEVLQEMGTETSKDALELLPVLAVCAPSRIPLQLFEMAWEGVEGIPATAAAEDDPVRLAQWHVDHLLSLVQADADQWDSFRLVEAVHLLEAFALLSTDAHEGEVSVSMHPLVHAWARDRQDDHAQHNSWVSMGCIMAISMDEDEYWRIHQRELRAHLQALTSWDMPCMFGSDPVVLVACAISRCGWRSHEMRDDMHLSMLMEKLFAYLGLSESTVDERWLDMYFLRARNHADCSRLKEAITLQEQLAHIRGRTLAEDHPDLLASQHVLASTYQANGQIQEAISLLEKVVQIEAQTLAEDHPDRLASQHVLADAYQANGQIQEAISLLEKVIQIEAQTLAEDHPDRLTSQHELARAYQANGQIQEAISLLEKVVQIKAQTLAEDHPNRLASQHQLARAYHSDGRIQEAISLLEEVVQIEAQTLAEDHPHRLGSQHSLATYLWDFGQDHAASQLMEYVVQVMRKALDEKHPSLANS